MRNVILDASGAHKAFDIIRPRSLQKKRRIKKLRKLVFQISADHKRFSNDFGTTTLEPFVTGCIFQTRSDFFTLRFLQRSLAPKIQFKNISLIERGIKHESVTEIESSIAKTFWLLSHRVLFNPTFFVCFASEIDHTIV